ncbi:MAG: YfjI family protein [Burkholderiaceae bacterium]|nr:YfjI family protein [Burkholderiaceae bacterium]
MLEALSNSGFSEPLTDFNDVAAIGGFEAVRHQVEAADAAFDQEPEPERKPPGQTEPEWPEPMVPGVLRTPDIPAAILPGAWGDMVAAVARSTQTPKAISVLCALGVLGTLLQRRFEVDCGTHTEPLPIWGASVSPSGTRKTAVAGAFQRPLLDWEKRRADAMRREIARNSAVRDTSLKRIESLKLQAGKAKPEDLEAIRNDIENELLNMPDEVRAPMLFVEDVTPETMQKLLAEQGGRMGVLSDEPGLFRILGGLYSGGGGASLEVFLKGHAGSSLKVHRAARSVFVDRPAVSMSLMVQPDLMADLAGSNQFRASGLMARFLWAVPVTNVGKRDVYERYRIPNEVRDAYNAAVLSMLEGYPPEPGEPDKPMTLRLDDCAEELWLDFSQEIEDQQGEGGPLDGIRDWTSKLPGSVARVAALLELAAGGLGRDTVRVDAMHQAITLARLLIPHTKAAFNLLGADALESDAIAVLKWVRGNGLEEFTQREAQKGMEARFRSVDKLKRAIDKLKDMDCVRVTKRRNKGTNKPTVVVEVNPAILS